MPACCYDDPRPYLEFQEYSGHLGTIESNVYQRTVGYPDEWYNGYHVMHSEELVTVRSSRWWRLGDRGRLRRRVFAE